MSGGFLSDKVAQDSVIKYDIAKDVWKTEIARLN